MRPALKWPGGKYRLLPMLTPVLPPGPRLVEPFAGSGAVFYNTGYPSAVLADSNPDVIHFHVALARRGREFIDACRSLFTPESNTPDVFYRRRDELNSLPVESPRRSELFLYLNRHGYNGLTRYNKKGAYNVPFGTYKRPYFPEVELAAAVGIYACTPVDFAVGDFAGTFGLVRKGDVVYCDPPYIPRSATSNFTAYSGLVFGPADQERLAACAVDAARRGATVVISNHDSPAARNLYRGATRIHPLSVQRSISCQGGGRAKVGELLAVYEPM